MSSQEGAGGSRCSSGSYREFIHGGSKLAITGYFFRIASVIAGTIFSADLPTTYPPSPIFTRS